MSDTMIISEVKEITIMMELTVQTVKSNQFYTT